MPITELPVLPAEYPLFDWADWPNSYAALVPGGPTKAFEKACWNGIVDYMAEAVESAGLQWRDGIQDPEYIQMQGEGNIRLKAYMFNSLMRAVDDVVQLPWRWEYDTAFRGYIGRQFFHYDINMEKDVVYPEYFTELVLHINRVIEIMRGTTQTTAIEVEYLADSKSRVVAEKKTAGPVSVVNKSHFTNLRAASESVVLGELIDFPKHTSSIQVHGPVWLNGGILDKRIRSKSKIYAAATRLGAGPMATQVKMNSLQYAELDYWRDFLEMQASLLVHSISCASMIQAPKVEFGAKAMAETTAAASMVQKPVRELTPEGVKTFFSIKSPVVHQVRTQDAGTARHLVKSGTNAAVQEYEAFPIVADNVSVSVELVEADTKPSLPMSSLVKTTTGNSLMPFEGQSVTMKAEKMSAVNVKPDIRLYRTAPVFSEKSARATIVCGLDVLNWEYPVWVEGGLWIRQAYYIDQNENGELEVR